MTYLNSSGEKGVRSLFSGRFKIKSAIAHAAKRRARFGNLRLNSQLYRRAIEKVVSRSIALGNWQHRCRRMSSGHSQIRVSRNDRCEFYPP